MDGIAGMSPEFTVSQAVAVLNQILDTALPTVSVVGEIANFKINQGKWVFFDLKDDESVLNCFMPLSMLRMELQDGMKVAVVARPNVTKWGRFSLTVRTIRPIGEGSIKKAFELLKKKLVAEGLCDAARKRPLPELPQHIGVISSVDAAGYKDFIKIISARMGGLVIDVISTQVQGSGAADQIIAAIRQFNEMSNPPEVIAILRGGGSRDDLAVFDDEKLVRVAAASRIPIITGVGHEIDTTLIDLVADVRASTPSNAAELLVPDRRELIAEARGKLTQMLDALDRQLLSQRHQLEDLTNRMVLLVDKHLADYRQRIIATEQTLRAYDPRAVLRRGYAILWHKQQLAREVKVGDELTAETEDKLIDMEVKNVRSK